RKVFNNVCAAVASLPSFFSADTTSRCRSMWSSPSATWALAARSRCSRVARSIGRTSCAPFEPLSFDSGETGALATVHPASPQPGNEIVAHLIDVDAVGIDQPLSHNAAHRPGDGHRFGRRIELGADFAVGLGGADVVGR